MICKYRDAENGMCSLRSNLSYPLLEYCVEGPCPDEVLICNNCPLDGHCEFVVCREKEGKQNVFSENDKGESAAKIIAGYCNKQTNCGLCRFADENGDCTLQAKIPSDWEMPKEGVQHE